MSEQENPEAEMSIVGHLEALRWHIIRSLIAVGICMIGFLIYVQDFIKYVVLAPFRKDFFMHQYLCQLNEMLCFEKIQVTFQATEPYEQFTRAIFLAFVGGLVVSCPYIVYEIWSFVKPGLHPKEQKSMSGMIWIISALFIIGVLFGYFVITPFSVVFLAGFQLSPEVQNIWRIGEVVALIAEISLAGGILFQVPVVSYFGAKLGLLGPKMMKKYRKHAVVVILIVAGILTPPDPFSQLFLGIPMYLLYEISIWITAVVVRNKEKAQ